jgi:4'-phosphopantetheinyl transferase
MYWLTQKLFDVPENNDWLTPNEIICMNKLRFPKRRAEWRLGRWTAKRTLVSYFENNFRSGAFRHARVPEGTTTKDYQIEIRAAADGAPEAFVQNQPVPITLSISHRDDFGFCVINPCNLAIGCDIEKVELRSDNFVEDYFTTEEKALITHAPEKNHRWLATLIWSAKESALKALRQGLRLDTRSVVVDVANEIKSTITDEQIFYPLRCFYPLGRTEWNHLSVRYTRTARTFHGCWRQKNEYIQTIITDLGAKHAENPTQHAGAGFCFE